MKVQVPVAFGMVMPVQMSFPTTNTELLLLTAMPMTSVPPTFLRVKVTGVPVSPRATVPRSGLPMLVGHSSASAMPVKSAVAEMAGWSESVTTRMAVLVPSVIG